MLPNHFPNGRQSRAQERTNVPVISSAVVQTSAAGGLYPPPSSYHQASNTVSSFPRNPSTRYGTGIPYGAGPFPPFQPTDDLRGRRFLPPNYPRLQTPRGQTLLNPSLEPQRTPPMLTPQQIMMTQRQQTDLQPNLHTTPTFSTGDTDLTGVAFSTGNAFRRSPPPPHTHLHGQPHPSLMSSSLYSSSGGSGVGSNLINTALGPLPPPPLNASVATSFGFTQNQLTVLKHQILVFRRMKKQEYAIDAEAINQTKPLPLPKKEGEENKTEVEPSNNHLPLFRLDHTNTASLPIKINAARILTVEYQRRINQKRKIEMQRIEQALRGPTNPGLPSGKRPNNLPFCGELMLKLRKLKYPRSFDICISIEMGFSRLFGRQKALRRAVEEQQIEIMKLSDRTYRRFVRDCNRTRFEMFKADEKAKSDKAQERAQLAKRYKVSLFDRSSTFRDFRTSKNKVVLRTHERQARSHNKQKDDAQVRRMEALKANDFEAYQELLRQQGSGPREEEDRYEEISRFLTDTEEYINRLASKVTAVKISQEASEAAAKAISEARAQGLSEEEVQIAAREAAQEVASTTELTKRSQNFGVDAQSRYYSLAHSIEEEVIRQPSFLRPPPGAFLRGYQIVGLQWMVSLYNNRLNGILADEMGLGKTVQVMALIAFLMEQKSDYGPHLIIVPNAVMVNWKEEFNQWLPSLRVVYYVGHKEERSKKFQQEVQGLQFNVLVTTYEFIMRDRAKLCRIQWHYIIIDEAQRMKDRQSKLAQDLNRFSAMRRLLLTGTPLQNDLQELWSLLNLLLPEVFDDKKCFTEWFAEVLGGGGGCVTSAQAPDDKSKTEPEWLETEKRVVVIHRLHQILEPFMLRRQVEDVERKLPKKISIVLKVAMSAYQSKIYNWVKSTGTLRLDPTGPLFGQRRHSFAPLNNKVMELRKVCNHPLLSYPHQEYSLYNLIRECGKFALLDKVLIKLKKAGHRVLLFSTMTKLLDLLELYMKLRQLDDGSVFNYRRIDGGTSLEDREVAIRDFNQADSNVFLFLLSIRAAGRGLNLQTADTVIIFDPDANPKNEEQAVARAYRIGQTKDVLVIYFETVAEPLNYESATLGQGSDRRYVDSIESLVRKTIQKQKIEMANEVIDAGRFDMRTTNEERKQTLENMLADEDRFAVATNQVPDPQEVNKLIARSEQEDQLFNALDKSESWIYSDSSSDDSPPSWVLFDDDDILGALKTTSRHHMKKELKKREAAGWKRPRLDEEVESKDQSFSLDQQLVDDKTEDAIDEDDEEFIAVENISLDEADFKDVDYDEDDDDDDDGGDSDVEEESLRKCVTSPTGAEIPRKQRSSTPSRKRRLDFSSFLEIKRKSDLTIRFKKSKHQKSS